MRALALALPFALAATTLAQTPGSQLPPADPNKRQEFTLVHADKGGVDGDDVNAEGHIHAQFKGYDIYADRLTGNRSTQIFRLEGNARLKGEGSDVFGDVITVDFRVKTFKFEDGKAELSPETLKGHAKAPVFVTTQSGQGTEQRFTIGHGYVTTCDKEVPHSRFVARSTTVRPNRYMALRDARLEILGHTVFGVPYLVIPLIDEGTRYLPDVGQSPTEGYYVKTRFSTPLHGPDYFDTRLDYMTRLGTGLGADLHYGRKEREGKITAYTLLGPTISSTVTADHKQPIGSGQFLFNGTYQQHNYLTAPQSVLTNLRAQYVLPWDRGNSRLSWYRVGSDTSFFSTVTQSLSLSDSHSWSPIQSTQIDANLSRSESKSSFGSNTNSNRLDLRFASKTSLRTFDTDLLYQRSVPVGSTENFFSATDRTPMLTLRTDSSRLFGPRTGRTVPFKTDFSIGELADPASGGTITRMDYNLNSQRTERLGSTSLRWAGGFKQGLYSDDTAQYVLDYNLLYSIPFAPKSKIDIGYRNHRAFGFTPLSIDRTGRNDAFSADVSWTPVSSLQLSARTGYDVLQGDRGNVPWQLVSLVSTWTPSKLYRLRGFSTFDTVSHTWSTSRLDASYALNDFRIGLGTRYDGRRSIWAGTSLLLQGFKVGRTTFETALDWNGYRGRFDAQHLSLIYDLHEAELVVDYIDNDVGFRSGRQIAVFFRLKAFPTRSGFGSGTRGQAVGSVGGFGY